MMGESGWVCSFNVQDTVVDTVDIYTYKCRTCNNSMKCFHVLMVEKYIEAEMDKQYGKRESKS